MARCVRSVERALARVRNPRLATVTVLALDSCDDATGHVALAAAPWLHLVTLDAGRVGAARAAAAERALALLAEHSAERIWLASTDADSAVPPDWLAAHLRHAESGADAVAGLVYLGDCTGRAPTPPAASGGTCTAAASAPGIRTSMGPTWA